MHPFALALRKVGEILHGFRSVLFEQAANDIAFRGIKDCVSTGLTWHKVVLSREFNRWVSGFLNHWTNRSSKHESSLSMTQSLNDSIVLIAALFPAERALVSACAPAPRALSFRLLAE